MGHAAPEGAERPGDAQRGHNEASAITVAQPTGGGLEEKIAERKSGEQSAHPLVAQMKLALNSRGRRGDADACEVSAKGRETEERHDDMPMLGHAGNGYCTPGGGGGEFQKLR